MPLVKNHRVIHLLTRQAMPHPGQVFYLEVRVMCF